MRRAFLAFTALVFWALPANSKKWSGIIAKEYDNAELWKELSSSLKDAKMHYGSVAASSRVLSYFSDLKSKEAAYQNIVSLIDFGYPFSLRPVFMAGDLELNGKDGFSQSYNLYKAAIDVEKKMPKWADNYFARIDKETFAKYLFYQALNEFNEKKLDESLAHLDKALAELKDPVYLSLSKKISRTMARIFYEQNKYKEALDIYQNYLLQMNPIEASDWLEGAWALYRLGRYEESLGYLYNLEVIDPGQPIYLEKYIIRALIYREKCATGYTRNLAKSFNKEFATTIEKIKMGESLKNLPALKKIVDRNSDYTRVTKIIEELEIESQRISSLPSEQRKLAEFLYTSEIKDQQRNKGAHEDMALTEAARRLVIMGESLRFLQFDVVREQYNPDKVFAPLEQPSENFIEDISDKAFLLKWLQWGDYWRDERTLYHGKLKNWCR